MGWKIRRLGGAGGDHGLRAVELSESLKRDNSYRRGYATERWKAYRLRFLAANPFCAACAANGLEEPAYAVDHIRRVSGADDPLFWEPTNHQPLCKRCHSRKTAKYDGGFGNRRRVGNITGAVKPEGRQ